MFRYQSYWMPEFVQSGYYPMKEAFFGALHRSTQARVLYRPYLHEYGWRERDRVKAMLSDVRFDESPRATPGMQSASLVVIDHPGTSFLEALAINVPTILFWDSQQCPERDEAAPSFALLRKAGILFDDPRAAAEQVNRVTDDPGHWWKSGAVQDARAAFSSKFALTDPQWKAAWVKALKPLMGDRAHPA
jgi:putative transferase (TIGR04331 family)